MSDQNQQLGVFLHLAQASLRRRRPLVRDRLFVLCSVLAANLQLRSLAEYCRTEILQHNPQHMIGRWPTVEQALLDEEFLQFLRRVRSEYPIERAEMLLDSLGIEITNERAAYYSTNEWAAAILNLPANVLTDQSVAPSSDEIVDGTGADGVTESEDNERTEGSDGSDGSEPTDGGERGEDGSDNDRPDTDLLDGPESTDDPSDT